MKDLRPKLIRLLRDGYCAPQIAGIADALGEPATTIYYNIKKLETEGAIKTYKAVFDHQKIEEGFCAYLLLGLSPYLAHTPVDPEEIAASIAKNKEVESVDIVSGDWEFIVKVRTKNQEEYYDFLKRLIEREGCIRRTCSIVSLKQAKAEFITTLTKPLQV
jgi:DNA-binding Lrp family transcriptional regulator